jgi:glycosyltransferase involved in cell wall biosynthesis
MKNVLIVCLRKDGAAPTFSIGLAEGFAQNGYNVYTVLSSVISNKEEWNKCDFLKQNYYLYCGDRRHYFEATLKYTLTEKRKIRKLFEGIKFEYTICTMAHPWATSVMKLVQAKKILSICHDPLRHSGDSRIDFLLSRKHFKTIDELIVLTKDLKEVAAKEFGFSIDKIHYMPHGKMSTYKKVQDQAKNSWYKEENINFLFFGRIKKYKGLHILGEAYKILSNKISNVTLTVAGNGNLEEYANEISNLPNVRIINKYVPDNEVGQYFDGPNVITVLPYLDATQSGIVPIAMEYESPVIASNTAGLTEQLDRGNLGIFFQAGNSEDLSKVMLSIVQNKENSINQIKLMRSFLHELEWSNVVKKLLISLS